MFWRCVIKRKFTLSLLTLALVLTLIIPTSCVPSGDDAANTSTTINSDRIAALEAKVSQLQSTVSSLPTSAGDYDSDIESLQADIDDLNSRLDDILIEVDDMLAAWGEEQQAESETENTTDVTTRWSLDTWTDYESFDLLDIELDYSRIEDDDDYTIWLLLYNESCPSIVRGANHLDITSPASGYLYYETSNKKLWKFTSIWEEVPESNWSNLYNSVEVQEVTIQFSPKSSDRVIVDEAQTELWSSGYPSFDWDIDFSSRSDSTCKRIEATADVRFSLPVPDRFINNDPEQPYPEQFKLEFTLAYA